MSEKKTGFLTITYKLRLYNRHHNWLLITKQLYNQVVWHYYQILMKETALLEQSNFLLLRALEECSIGTKEMRARGEEPLWKMEKIPKVPLYFRRAAINTAIGLARSYMSSYEIWQKKKKQQKSQAPSPAAAIYASPVFYKGMYREFGEDSVQLKVYNGEKWVWITYPYIGRKIPKEGKILSPTLKIEKKTAYLHIPVELPVKDIRSLKERMEVERQICAVSFPDGNSLAVCVVMEKNGIVVNHHFIYGGNTREVQRKNILKRLEKSKKSRKSLKSVGKEPGGVREIREETTKEKSEKENEITEEKNRIRNETRNEIIEEKSKEKRKARTKENQVFYKKLEQINQYYAHKVSHEILEYCKKNQIKVIVVPNYENSISFRERAYLHTNQYRWQGRAIIRNLKYKAMKDGILVTMIRPYHISDCCSECGSKIQRYNEGHKASRNYYGGQLFLCPNGHQGNAALNTAKNIGRYFLIHFQKESYLFCNRETGDSMKDGWVEIK